MQPCECCGAKEDVNYVIDPYHQGIYYEEIWMWLCKICEQIKTDDI